MFRNVLRLQSIRSLSISATKKSLQSHREQLFRIPFDVSVSSASRISYLSRKCFTSCGDTTINSILDEVEAKVFQVLKSSSKCKFEKLSNSATFEELGFDSLESVELIVAMEELFGFDITNEEAEKISTVQEAIAVFNKTLVEKLNRDKLVEIQLESEITPFNQK